MPAAMQDAVTVFASGAPSNGATSTEKSGMNFDHLLLFVTFTKAGATSVQLKLQFSLDGNTWYDVYDGAQTLVAVTMNASFTGAIYLSSEQNTTRLTYAVMAAPLWRIAQVVSGTVTSDALAVQAIGFSVGAVRE